MLVNARGVQHKLEDSIYTAVKTINRYKKPAGLAPCGLSGLHRMTLVITDGEFWWSWLRATPNTNWLILWAMQQESMSQQYGT
jgi:hypothetical protein